MATMPVHLVYSLEDIIAYGNKNPKGACSLPAAHAQALGGPTIEQIVRQAQKMHPHLTIEVHSDSLPFSIMLQMHKVPMKNKDVNTFNNKKAR